MSRDRGGGCQPLQGGPIAGDGDNVGALQGEQSRRLGKADVVADGHPDAPDARLVNGKRDIPVRGEAIEPESRKVGLPIESDEPLRTHKHRRIVDRVRTLFEQPDDGVDVPTSAHLGETIDRRAGHGFRQALQLVEVVEQVAGERALGKDHQARALNARFPKPRDDLVEIPLVRAELGGGLGNRHPHRRGRSVLTEFRCHDQPPRPAARSP